MKSKLNAPIWDWSSFTAISSNAFPPLATNEGLEYNLTTAIQKLNHKISALLSLEDKIQVKLFLSSSLESVGPYIGIRNLPDVPEQIEQVVKKLNQKNYDRLSFEFLNPSSDKEIDEVSGTYNIMTLKWPAISKGNIPPGRGAIGLLLQHRDKSTIIPVLQVSKIPIFGTQYDLVKADQLEQSINQSVESLIDINEGLGYLTGNGTLPSRGRKRI